MDPNDNKLTRRRPLTAAGRLGAWMEIGTLLAVASFFAYSFLAVGMQRFLAPYYIWLTPAAAVALYAMGIARLRAHLQGYVAGELEEASAWQVPVSACMVVLITPIVFALWQQPTELSREGRKKRERRMIMPDAQLDRAVDWILGRTTGEKEVAGESFSLPAEPTILEVLEAVRDGHGPALQGQFVSVLGQCDLPQGPQSPRFDLYRLVVTCCIADSTAVSLEITRPRGVRLESGGWVRIDGIIKFDGQLDPSLPVIHATNADKIPEPSEPYL